LETETVTFFANGTAYIFKYSSQEEFYRMYEETFDHIINSLSSNKKMIEVQNLTKEFNGKTVLNGISFQVKEGEIFGYLDPNGAGKTTTMRIILGRLKPTEGKAHVMGNNLGDDEELRKNVGIVLESDGLYDRLTAYDNFERNMKRL
jgi:ABC-type transporter Mla maintaining outer membrane lipid asymmetry ATPase subunit MlaF